VDDGDLIARLRAGRTAFVRVSGSSMWPAIRDGALLRVEPRPADALRRGDLGAFELQGLVVVHRVVAPLEGGFVRLRGDAMEAEDPPVPVERILGVARLEQQRSLRLRLPRPSELRVLWRWLRRR
jgi:hypothetical protein